MRMSDEYSPMDDIGLRSERFFICPCDEVFITDNYLRGLCDRYIKNGATLYDAIAKYETISSFMLHRSNDKLKNRAGMVIPFLKASGITDHDAYEFAKETVQPMPGSCESIRYLSSLMPTFMFTEGTEHLSMTISDLFGIRSDFISDTKVDFDAIELDRNEAKKIRGFADTIANLKVTKEPVPLDLDGGISREDTDLFYKLDDIFNRSFPELESFGKFTELTTAGSNERSYFLLNTRHNLQIDFDDIAYVGHDAQDSVGMELVKEKDGLSISFNGDNFALKEANIAVMSDNPIVVAVLTAEFYDYGIDSVFDLVENWNKDYLSTRTCSDRNLMDTMLAQCKKKLPVVKRVTRDNLDELTEESMTYRRKMRERFRRH